MRVLTVLLLIGLSPWAMAKEFKMPCVDYEALTGEKVCDISPMIPTTSEEIESIKARQKHQACLADFKAQYPQCFVYSRDWQRGGTSLPDECYDPEGHEKLEKLCPRVKAIPVTPRPPTKTHNVWG